LGAIGDDRREGGRGVRIVKIDAGSPADEAALKAGDLVFKVNDQPIRNGRDMQRALEKLPAGSKLTFHIDRDGAEKEREVTLGVRPAAEKRTRQFGPIGEALPPPTPQTPAATVPQSGGEYQPPVYDSGSLPPNLEMPNDAPSSARAVLGVRSAPATELERIQHGAPSKQGATVMAIEAGSPAQSAGVPLDSIIVAIDGKTITGPSDLARRIATYEPGDEVEVSFYYKQELYRRRLVLADSLAPPEAAVFVAPPPGAQAAADRDAGKAPTRVVRPSGATVAELEQKVDMLSRRVAELEKTVQDLKAGK
jgi:predicted metalloprotease with PDZ domain